MKIRTGFVSNSSSSSFVVSDKEYTDVFDLAVAMIEVRDKDWDEYTEEYGGDKKYQLLSQQILNARKDICVNIPITFPTTNYHTFIAKYKDNFIVSTCNNHEFYDMNGFVHASNKEDIVKELGFGHWEELENRLSSAFWFWYPHLSTKNNNIFAKEILYQYSQSYKCKGEGCYDRKILLQNNHEVMCPQCTHVSPVNPEDLEKIHQYSIKNPHIESIHNILENYKNTEDCCALNLKLDFADKILAELHKQNIDLKTLSEKTGIKKAKLEKILHSEYNLKVSDMAKIAYTLGVAITIK